MNEEPKKLVLVLDWPHKIEQATREPLAHGGGQLLKALLRRMSLRREQWVHAYCFQGNHKKLSGNKKERLRQMAPHLAKMHERIELNRPCVVVGLGKVPCEALIGASLLSSKAGTCWSSPQYGKVWITYSPDAALFDPVLTVSIYGVLTNAAMRAGLTPQFDPEARMFDWRSFMVYNRRKTYAIRNE